MNKSNKNIEEIAEGEVVQSPYAHDTMQDNKENVKSPKKRDLSFKAVKFAKNYIEGETMGNGTKSAIKAGYSEASASVQAVRLLKDVRVLAILNENVEQAEATIKDLMYDESPAIRLAASKEILDRTVGKPIQRRETVQVNITVESMLNGDD